MYTFFLRLMCLFALLWCSCKPERPRPTIIRLSTSDSIRLDSINNVFYNNRYSDQHKSIGALQVKKEIYDQYDTVYSKVDFYSSMVWYFSEIGIFDAAKKYVDSQWRLLQNNPLLAQNLKATVYASKGLYFAAQDLWDSAINNNLEALDLLKDCPDVQLSLSIADAISLAYIHQGNYEKAFYYYRPYIDQLNKPGKPARKLDILMNIFGMGNDSKNDSLEAIGDRCLFMAKQLADSVYLENAQPALDCLLARYYYKRNNIDSSLYYGKAALAYMQKGSEMGELAPLIYEGILKALIDQDRYSEAKVVLKDMQQHTDTAQYTAEMKSNYYRFLYQLELKYGSESKALKALQQLKIADDRLYTDRINDQLLKYETQMKRLANQNFIKEKEYEAKNQRYYVIFVTIIAVLALGASVYIYCHWKKKRSLERKYWQQQQKQQEMEHKNQLWEERNRISTEMHDDLGATLTTTLMAVEMVEMFPEQKEHLNRIRTATDKMYRQVSEIIWNLNTKNDDVSSLNSYMHRFASDFLTQAHVQLKWNINVDNRAKVIPSFQRRMIYLAFKELINNIVKHAQATLVTVRIQLHRDAYQLDIEDNGIGIQSAMEQKNTRYGSTGAGLENIKRNISRISGVVNWQRLSASGGCRVRVTVPVAGL